ncbi:SlyX protein [Kushneria avicenniae]|uniref:SlyX protein n=1 Tax=Kushneria avicenniae TaxID=402385 RepID=A0A1I1HW62_9GAMM|nr:SlyX family protein [Kushneria avicenniae]SFC28081.1 SlyX protein [Kushneria avicenniae]
MHIDTTLKQVIERVNDLESRLAWQEDWLERLDDTLITQNATIERLERLCNLMAQRLGEQRESLESMQADSGDQERPPHY